ncbi:hypothetical protein XA68_12660 [Ophiocordyceps unilateralis]|uniref:Sodium/calcium exchanger membrane region domain-containing protein n=1 Tax=Ophiocordyceps unilateralis TaxID=268505 RepID=A0A2A9PDW6_OPHUN|nr:hypothetical protein XA68_12660 [Ophiocordyceps unilateralis]
MEEASSNNARRHVCNNDSAAARDDDDDEPSSAELPGFDSASQSRLCALKDSTLHAFASWLVFAGKLKRCYRPTSSSPSDDEASGELRDQGWAYGPVAGPLCDMIFSSWLNALLFFVPVGLASKMAGLGPVVVFATNAAAIVPLSALLTDATELHCLSLTLSLSLSLSLISIAALAHDHVRIVQASILGSVLVNLLLILGSALVVGSAANGEPAYNAADAQLLACLLSVSVFTFLMPTAFNYSFSPGTRSSGLLSLNFSRMSSLLILAIYVLYLFHEIRSRCRHTNVRALVDLESNLSIAEQRRLPPALLPLNTGHTVDMSSLHVPENGDPRVLHPDRGRRLADSRDDFRPRADSWQPSMSSRKLSPSPSFWSLSRDSSVGGGDVRRGFSRSSLTMQILRDVHPDRDQPVENRLTGGSAAHEVVVAIVMLVLTSGLMSINAELLVSTIDDVTRQTNLSEPVIGLILLPIVGNIAEYVTVVAVAAREKLDLAIAVAVGSSIQIALCVTPLTVLAGWILHKDLALTFNTFEIATLVGAVLLVNLLILNETGSSLRTGSLKGVLMCACYLIIGLGAYFAPAIEA